MNFKKREPSSPRSVLEDPSRHRGPPFLPLFAAIGGIAAGLLHHRNKSKQQEEVLVASGSPSGRFSGGGSELVLHSSAMANKQQMVPVVVKTGSGREMVVPYADLTYEQQFQLQQQQQQFLAYQRGGGAPASPGIGYSPQRAPVASFGPTNGVPSSMVLNIYTGGDTPQETPPPPPPPPERGPGAAVMDWLKQTGVVALSTVAIWEFVRPVNFVKHDSSDL